MCRAIGCLCLGQTGHLQVVAASRDTRFGVHASVSSRNAVGSLIDRFRWPHPISHDWPTWSHNPLVFSSQDAREDKRNPEPHPQNIDSSRAQRTAPFEKPRTRFETTLETVMEFSRKDLEDIQRVAGLLNLTVDELLQQSRKNAIPASNSPQPSPHNGRNHKPSMPLFSGSPVAASQYGTSPDFGLGTFDSGDPHSNGGFESDPSELSLPPPVTQDLDTEVILLNPHTALYDCDVAILGSSHPSDESLPFDDGSINPDIGEDGSYVPVTEMDVDSGSISEYTVREDAHASVNDDASTDWALVSPSPRSPVLPTLASPSTGPSDKRYYRIAPKFSKSSAASESSSHRVKKKRSPYEGSKRIDTHLTRQLHACVRCRMQRNRCIPDPINPRGPCLTCQQRTVRMSRLPCLRYMVTDSTLFRTGLDYMPFYRTHPMVGPHYGDFHLERQWTDAPPKFLCLGQVGSMHIKVELREFVPPANNTDVDLKGRPMYAVPWAVADPEAVVEALTEYIDRAISRYMEAYLDDTDPLVWNIFQAAYRASVFPVPNEMLKKTLRLWVACRFIESKWRCWSETGWADDELLALNPKDPFYKDLDSLPPYFDYQIASIIMHRILGPLRKDVLRILQSTFNTHNPKDWFATFLTSFILLQNYEMQMLFQRQFANRRSAPVQYLDMPLVRATNSGAKTILAHFHYCYKGQQLFTKNFDWTAPRVRRMARLDAEQSDFMAQCRDVVVRKAPTFQVINTTDVYHEKWWYTSQLFDPDWTPRETLEHAPPAEPSIAKVA